MLQALKNAIRHVAPLTVLCSLILSVTGAGHLAVRASAANAATDVAQITAAINAAGLPVASVKTHENPSAGNIAIYVPQYHLNPGTSAQDSANAPAVQAQQEISGIISFLTEKEGAKFVMAEGDLYGPVSDSKISGIAQKIAAKDNLSSDEKALESAISGTYVTAGTQPTLTGIDNAIKSAEEEITLEGAPYVLKSQGGDFALYGAENASTLAKCTDIVRNYIYLQDRLASLQGGNGLASYTGITRQSSYGSSSPQSISQILAALGGGSAQPVETQVATLASNARTNNQTSIADAADKIASDLRALNAADAALKASEAKATVNNSQPAPSRSDNPYAGINNVNQLNSMLQQSEQQVQQYVIDERNTEAAANFAKGLQETGNNVGILQFGAGHEEGLVSELQKQGLSVIVVTSKEVAAQNALNDSASQPQSQPVQQPSPIVTANSPSQYQNVLQNYLKQMLGANAGTTTAAGQNPLLSIIGNSATRGSATTGTGYSRYSSYPSPYATNSGYGYYGSGYINSSAYRSLISPIVRRSTTNRRISIMGR
jgi:hypothetical protein